MGTVFFSPNTWCDQIVLNGKNTEKHLIIWFLFVIERILQYPRCDKKFELVTIPSRLPKPVCCCHQPRN